MNNRRHLNLFSLSLLVSSKNRRILTGALVMVAAIGATLLVARSYAAETRFPWPTSLTNLFARGTGRTLSAVATVNGHVLYTSSGATARNVAVIGTGALAPCTPPSTVYVDDDWVAVTPGTDPDGVGPATDFGCDSFATIDGGVNGVTAGGTVIVAAGTYAESNNVVHINKSLTISGPNSSISPNGVPPRAAEAVITSQGTNISPNSVFVVDGINRTVTIEGFKFDGVPAAVNAYSPNDVITLQKNIFTATHDPGMYFETPNLTINDNRFIDITIQTEDTIFIGRNFGVARAPVSITNNVWSNVSTAGGNLEAITGTISGNTFLNVVYYGFLIVRDSGDLTISGNTFDTMTNPDPVGVPTWGAGIRFYEPTVTSPVNITGNTFANSFVGVGIRGVPNDAGADITGMPIHVNFNRFINNNSGISDGAAGTLEAENNWWGCNYGPGTGGASCTGTPNGIVLTGTAIVDSNPWLVLGLSAAPNPIAPGGTSTVTADMTDNSAAADTSALGFVPPTPVAFTATEGTIMPAGGTTTAGQVSSTFTSTSNSNGTACATVDGQLKCTNVLLSPVTITPATSPTASDNDYTRINNAVQIAVSGQTIRLVGTFDWTEANAAASWALGSNGLAGDIDDYSIYPAANLNNVTFTADNLGDATIQGPGDLAVFDLEAVFYFDGGDNQNWTISNIRFLDFDNPIGMFFGAGGADAFNNTHIMNNYIRLPADLNATVAPGDVASNIGIHYACGMNQIISGNTFDIPGNAVSDSANSNFATDVAMQSNSTGGSTYDGLQITNNTIHVLNAPSADPEVTRGIWENGNAHLSNITVSGNSFTNQGAGNNPLTNLQVGFRISSHSSATTTVTYQNNNVSGANVGFEWLAAQDFSANQAVIVKSNTITGNATGVLVQSQGLANLSFNRIVGNTVAGLNNASGTVNAENNWWGCNAGPGVGSCDSILGTADSDPWLVLGVSAAPNPINPFGTSTVTADMTHNSAAADTSALGTLPLTPVAFTATEGTIAPTPGTITAGQETSVFTSTTGASGTVCAMVDNQLTCTNILTVTAVTVSLPHVTGPTTTTISVPITVGDLTGKGVQSYDLQITFDPAIVQPEAIPYDTGSTLSSGMTVTFDTSNPGHLILSASQASDLSGSGTLIKLQFQIIGGPGGSTATTFADYTDPGTVFHPGFRFNAGVPAATTSNGSIHVNGPTATDGDVSGQILESNGRPVEGAAVRMSGTQNRLTITDAEGRYHFEGVETNGVYTVTPSRRNFGFSPMQRSFSQQGPRTEAVFSGAYNGGTTNPLDADEYFVRQQYLDFLGREPDEAGFNFWVSNIAGCGVDANCRSARRTDTSGAFFLSIEFQQTGYLVYRMYHSAYGDMPESPVPLQLAEFAPDTRAVGLGVVVNQSGWEGILEANKQALIAEFVQRARFNAAYPTTLGPVEFVDRLFMNAGVRPEEIDRAAAIAEFGSTADTADAAARGRALRKVAENSLLVRQEFNQAFVLMQYFGYLKRDPNAGPDTDFSGYTFWLSKLDSFNGNFGDAEMVKAFLVAGEYRGRFPR